MNTVSALTTSFLPLLATIAVTLLVILTANAVLRRRWKDMPDAQFHFQLIMLALTIT